MHHAKHRILIIGKENAMREEIMRSLHEHYIDVDAFCVYSVSEALACISRYQYTLIIMELAFSVEDGPELIRKLRTLDSVPILVLSARATVADEVALLHAGADRYIGVENAMDIERCLANAQAIMRRYTKPDTKNFAYTLVSGCGLKINLLQRRAYANGNDLHLTPKQFALLTSLVERMGSVVTKEQLYEDAWEMEFDINSDEALKYHIKELRKKLKVHGLDHLIETAWGVGYYFSMENDSGPEI